ncbi:hypothetical protein BofuT4_uP149440.1 [Botrytis cinerea T4]|uniref:Uncharacterized protein n=1 Tax=Botryotinia fuckeliana (strain T4) TaxID=999810 RepID=G2YX96_BOTF4|nr:hypothetical protein BofuT4_uP149440.1 [Botrytis cinerea T4]
MELHNFTISIVFKIIWNSIIAIAITFLPITCHLHYQHTKPQAVFSSSFT